ncbi:MAG: BatA and WFA domain-containing protein [Sedimentisphaerales bacterium]|nr:BatA and WFA domain-containing protein [Sedimentisphaerales bacterium]
MYFLGYPLALWALSSLPVLGGIYWLRNRYKQVTISSSFLWDQYNLASMGGRKFQRLQTPLLFILEMIILTLLAVAGAEPLLPLGGVSRELVIVLDDSWSMQAKAGDHSFREAALEKIYQEFGTVSNTRAAVVLAGRNASLAGSDLTDKAALEKALEKWTCGSYASDLSGGIALAGGISTQKVDVLVVSDKLPDYELAADSRILWQSVGRSADNMAITNAFRRSDENGSELLMLEIAARGSGQMTRQLVIEAQTSEGFAQLHSQEVAPEPGTALRLAISVPQTRVSLKVSLTGRPDALSADDTAVLLSTHQPPLRVAVSLNDSDSLNYVKAVVESSGLCEITTTNPELVISDEIEYLEKPGQSWQMVLLKEPDAVSFGSPFLLDSASPILDGTGFAGVIWGAAREYKVPAAVVPADATATENKADAIIPGKPLVMAGNITLLSLVEVSGRRNDLLMRWNPQVSTLQNTITFPVIFANYFQLCLQSRSGIVQANVNTGDDMVINLPPQTVSLAMTAPDKQVTDFSLLDYNSETFTAQAAMPGIYEFSARDAVGTETVSRVSANSFALSESDLTNCQQGTTGGYDNLSMSQSVYVRSSWLFALLALLILAWHGWLLWRNGGAI